MSSADSQEQFQRIPAIAGEMAEQKAFRGGRGVCLAAGDTKRTL